jgi:hypothetical protein
MFNKELIEYDSDEDLRFELDGNHFPVFVKAGSIIPRKFKRYLSSL